LKTISYFGQMIFRRLQFIFFFYKQFLLISLLFDFLFLYFEISLFVALVVKILMAGLLFWVFNEGKRKYKLNFYRNLGISPIGLFSISFLMDVLLMLLCYLIHSILLHP